MTSLSNKVFKTTVSTALPPEIPLEKAIAILHDYESLSSMSPKWKRSQRKAKPSSRQSFSKRSSRQHPEYWEIEEEVPWIPKWLWNGTAKYSLEFTPISNGCDVTIWANWRFTSVNHWRMIRGWILESGEVALSEGEHSGWLLQTESETVYHRTCARLLKRHAYDDIKSMHVKFIDQLMGNVS